MNLDLTKLINPHFYPLLFDKHRYLVMYGGAGSGKSHFAAQKLLLRIIKAGKEGYRHRFLALRKTGPAARKSIFTLFKRYVTEWGLSARVNKTDMAFEFSNGSEIYCGGLDDPEKIKSIEGITGIWLEEPNEFNQEDFEQADLRLRGITPDYKQIILSFNPISRMIWLFKRFFETADEDSSLHHSTYLNNCFLDDEYKGKLENLKKKTPTSTWSTLKGFGAYLRISSIRTGRLLTDSPKYMTSFTALTLGSTIRMLCSNLVSRIRGFMSRNFSIRAGLPILSSLIGWSALYLTSASRYTQTRQSQRLYWRSHGLGSTFIPASREKTQFTTAYCS